MNSLLLVAGLVVTAATIPEGARGVVVDSGGKPIAGALVVLVRQETGMEADREQATRSDDQGRFAFESWRADGASWFVLAHKTGLALGGSPVRDAEFRSRSPDGAAPPHDLKLRLPQPTKIRVRLETATGQALNKQASVSLVRFGVSREAATDGRRGLVFSAPVPRALAEPLSLRLERDGTVILNCLPPDSIFALEIKAPGLGIQRASYLNSEPAEGKSVRLERIGSLSGRIVAGDPKVVVGVKVQVWTASPQKPERISDLATTMPIAQGYASAVTDETGRFEIKEIAAGQARLTVFAPNERGWLPPSQSTAVVEVGKTAEVKVELTRGVRVLGRVVADGSGQGIEGVVASVGGVRVRTNAQGEFQAYAMSGPLFISFLHIPLPWLAPFHPFRNVEVPGGRQVHQLAPTKLQQGLPLQGSVVNEGGRPVAGARVSAVWQKSDGQSSTLGSDTAVSGADGQFVLQRISGDVELGLTARTDERATPDFVTVPPRQRQPFQLTVRSEAAVAFEGRVRDEEGKPVPAARVQFHQAIRLPGNQNYGRFPLAFGEGLLKTDAGGSYRTPTKVARNERYSMTIEAPGMLKYESLSVTPGKEGEVFRWPEVVLRHERVAAGIVIDRAGKPVSGAAVSSHGLQRGMRVITTSDSAGKFRLANVHPDARIVIVEKAGHRPTGDVIPKSGELCLTLESQDDPPAALLRSIRRPAEERQRLLKDLLVPILPRLKEAEDDYFVAEALKRLAPYDRAFVLNRIDRLSTDRYRVDVLVALGALDDALESAALVKDPYSRAYQYLTIADAADDAVKKQLVLTEALIQGRLVEQPDHRAVVLSSVAERLLKLGNQAAAQKVFDEGKLIALQLAPTQWSGFARGRFAESLAIVDTAAALELLKALKDENELTRHAGNIAHKLAGRRPAEAEEALKLAKKDDRYLSPYAVRVCYRMAPVDLPRARRIADGFTSPGPSQARAAMNKAQAYGAMAMAIAGKDSATARELLRRAFDQLALSERDRWFSARHAFPIAAMLIGYAETVDPERTREYFWRTLALHPGPVVDAGSPEESVRQSQENNAQLVLLLALYGQYPDLQAELLEPMFRYWSAYTNREEYSFSRANAVFMAMALAAPRQAIAWHSAFHPKLDKEDRRLIPQPWMNLADVFAHEGLALHQRITQQVFGLWVIDKED